MTAKEYLGQAYGLDQQIGSKLEQISVLRSLTQKITGAIGGEPVSHTRRVTSLEDAIIRLMEAEDQLNHQIDRLLDLQKGISACIAQVTNQSYRMILERRYLCFQSWEKIAADMQCTVRWVHILHGRALHAVGRIDSAGETMEEAARQFPPGQNGT